MTTPPLRQPTRATYHEKIAMRRDVILGALRERPWSTARMLTDAIYEEAGSLPGWAGGLWIAPWTMYSDLLVLERDGKVERRWITKRTILWRAT